MRIGHTSITHLQYLTKGKDPRSPLKYVPVSTYPSPQNETHVVTECLTFETDIDAISSGISNIILSEVLHPEQLKILVVKFIIKSNLVNRLKKDVVIL